MNCKNMAIRENVSIFREALRLAGLIYVINYHPSDPKLHIYTYQDVTVPG